MLFEKQLLSTWQVLANRQILGRDARKPCKLKRRLKVTFKNTDGSSCLRLMQVLLYCQTTDQGAKLPELRRPGILDFLTRYCGAAQHRKDIALCFFINAVDFSEAVKWAAWDHFKKFIPVVIKLLWLYSWNKKFLPSAPSTYFLRSNFFIISKSLFP